MKKSKKSKKSSRIKTERESASRTTTTDAAPSPRPQLNPFYIEPPSRDTTWKGDYNWNDNEDEYEDEYTEQAQGLLSSDNQMNHGTILPRHERQEDESWKIRACALCLILPMLVMIVWSALASSPPNGSHSSLDTTRTNPTRAPVAQRASTRRPIATTTMAPMAKRSVPSPTRVSNVAPVANKSVIVAPSPKSQQRVRTHQPSRLAVAEHFTNAPVASPVKISMDDDESDTNDDDVNDDDTSDTKSEPKATPVDRPTDATEKTNRRTTLVVLGERHSGVEWLLETLAKCYPSVDVRSGYKGVRSAYWFQYPVNGTTIPPVRSRTRRLAVSPNTTVVAMVRDPYQWVLDMWLHPLHAPAHANGTVPLSLRKFLSQPWSMDRVDRGPWMEFVAPASTSTCQLGLTPQQVTPCLALSTSIDVDHEETVPVYELDANGQVFANIMALRAAKIRYLVDDVGIARSSPTGRGAIVVSFESGLDESLWSALDAAVGQTAVCRPTTDATWVPVAPPRTNDTSLVKQMEGSKFKKWMLEHVQWREEARIAYFPAAT